jgi:diguanylate cyclase (GGDEF)-like protein/PAS domain S-box-containing protein
MQGPVVDILVMLLLILFFGLHQRSRPELYFRFWFAGWLLVLASYVVWEFSPAAGLDYRIENSIRYDLMVLAGIAFSMSLLVTADRLRDRLVRAAMVAVPACVAIDLQMMQALPSWAMRPVLVGLVVAGHGFALVTIRRDLPRALSTWRTTILVLFGGLGVAMAVRALVAPQEQVMTWVITEIMLFAAVLYASSQERVTVAGVVGSVGFTAWGLFYHMAEVLAGHPAALQSFYLFWNLPKFCVGFSMIVRVFEDAAVEKAVLLEELGRRYEDFRLLYEGHPYSMFLCEPGTGRILSVNRAFVKASGFSREELQHRSFSEFELGRDTELESMERAIPAAEAGRLTRFQYKNGETVWVTLSEHGTQFQGQEARLLTMQDVTEGIHNQRLLLHQANHDALTGLPNLQLLGDRLQQSIDRCEREHRRAAVYTIDIDHFKRINDTYGHPLGDACLKEVATRLVSRVRLIDTMARTGGEEFTAVVGGLSGPEDGEKIACGLLAAFQTPILLGDVEVRVTVSIGVAMYPEDGMDGETLRRRSDRALYLAKQAGRDRAEYSWSRGAAAPVG